MRMTLIIIRRGRDSAARQSPGEVTLNDTRSAVPARALAAAFAAALCLSASGASAQFSATTSAETRPEGSGKLQQSFTRRHGKEHGEYTAWNMSTSVEYGLAHNFTLGGALRTQSIDTSGLLVPGYLPGDESYTLKFAGFDISGKHKFLNTAEDDIGVAAYWHGHYDALDKHSGLGKTVYALETGVAVQKYFMEGQLTWLANASVKAVHATRDEIAVLDDEGNQAYADVTYNGQLARLYFPGGDPERCKEEDPEGGFLSDDPSDRECFEWPNFAEMEIELKFATGFSFRFANNWYLSVEALWEQEHETEVNRERYSLFVGPGLHFEGQRWSASVGWLKQVNGGGEKIDPADELHFIEKTDNELRLKVAYNF